MESIRGAMVHRREVRIHGRKIRAQQKVRGNIRQGKHKQDERQEACIAGYVRRELMMYDMVEKQVGIRAMPSIERPVIV